MYHQLGVHHEGIQSDLGEACKSESIMMQVRLPCVAVLATIELIPQNT